MGKLFDKKKSDTNMRIALQRFIFLHLVFRLRMSEIDIVLAGYDLVGMPGTGFNQFIS